MASLVFAGFAYLLFNAASLGCFLFVADLWLPQTLDRSIWPALPGPVAAAIDLSLIALFGLQHSVMARRGWKQWLQRHVPAHLERTTYVIASSVALAALVLLWQPIPGTIWQAESDAAAVILWALYAAGWLLVVASTYMIDHYEMFGIRQVWRHRRGLPEPGAQFRTPYLYRYVRHPLYVGFLLAFWATPQMSTGHLLFATGMTVYILIGVFHEERDLLRVFGDAYREYRARVPSLIPGLKFR